MTYKEHLADPRWQRKRLQILERDNWTCKLCGDTKTQLHVHHKKYTGWKAWEAIDEDLVTICKVCHTITEFKHENIPIEKIIKHKLGTCFIVACVIKSNGNIIDVYYYDSKRNKAEYQYMFDIKFAEDVFLKILSNKKILKNA